MRKLKSIIWTIGKMELESIINSSDSFCEVLDKLGLSRTSTGSRKNLYIRLKNDNIDVDYLKEKAKIKKINGCKRYRDGLRKKNIDIFIENSHQDRLTVKKRLLEENLIEYKCEKCGNNGEWLGEKISLQLDHKNGINNDNRLENLRFLCPNCHSQTDTFGFKNVKRIKHVCEICNEDICRESKKCKKCCGDFKKKFIISKDELQKLIETTPMTKIGEMFGVSDNAVRKRCKKLGVNISKTGRGCWSKVNDM